MANVKHEWLGTTATGRRWGCSAQTVRDLADAPELRRYRKTVVVHGRNEVQIRSDAPRPVRPAGRKPGRKPARGTI